MERKPTGLFFGSFNPVHTGHMIIADYFLKYGGLKQVWFVVSPQNPFKVKKSLLAGHHRLAMVRIAIEDEPNFRVIDLEFKLPRPSYTIDTLTYLEEEYPDNRFILLMGSDQLPAFEKWKNPERILGLYNIYVYLRPGFEENKYTEHPSVRLFQAPQLEISSSMIRRSIRSGKDMRYMLPEKVYNYIKEMHFYEK